MSVKRRAGLFFLYEAEMKPKHFTVNETGLEFEKVRI